MNIIVNNRLQIIKRNHMKKMFPAPNVIGKMTLDNIGWKLSCI